MSFMIGLKSKWFQSHVQFSITMDQSEINAKKHRKSVKRGKTNRSNVIKKMFVVIGQRVTLNLFQPKTQ